MAIAVYADREVMDQMMFGPPQPQFLQYIRDTNQYFMNTLTDVGRQFVQHAQNVFARTNTHEAMEIAKAAMRISNVHMQHDVIYTVESIEQLQEAPDSMVRWVMSHPELRQLYHTGHVDGYGSRYLDMQPSQQYGWTHLDYQVVYTGWMNPVVEVQQGENGEEVETWYDEWTEVLMDEDDADIPLLLDVEAASIMSAHVTVDKALADKRDPTSYYDNPII